MNRLISQMPLNERIPTLKEAVLATRAMKENYTREEANLMEELARAEGEVSGKAPGSEGVQLSGLIPEGENPHAPAQLDPDFVGDNEPQDSFLGQVEESPASAR